MRGAAHVHGRDNQRFAQRLFRGNLPGESTGLAGGTVRYFRSPGTTREAGRVLVQEGNGAAAASVSGGDPALPRPEINARPLSDQRG